MCAKKDILSLLSEQEGKAATAARQALIIQPGAIGDCILTLPLAQFMKSSLNLGNVVFLGHLGYTGIFAGRSCVDGVKSIESIDIHRLFLGRKEFDLEDHDPLLTAFAPYNWIVTFLGEPDSDFEHNLIYTAHCTHSAEVITLRLKSPAASSTHISHYYIEQFMDQLSVNTTVTQHGQASPIAMPPNHIASPLLTATDMDKQNGAELLKAFDIDATSQNTIVLAPGSGAASKCWPIENYIAVAKQLASNNFKVLFLLGPAELDRFSPALIDLLSRTAPCASDMSLTEVLQILSVSDGFVGNDSGITHLSGSLGIRTVAVFSPTQSDIYKPCGPNVHALQIPPEKFDGVSSEYQEQIVHILLRD